jgi:chromosome segregation ATPase
MKNKFYLYMIFAVLLAAPVLAETLALDDEEDRSAPVPAATAVVKPAATAGVTAIQTPYQVKALKAKSTVTAIPAATTVKTAATAADQQPQVEELKSKVDYIKNSLESALSANNDLAASLREIQSDIRRIEERSLEIKGMAQDMADLKDRVKVLEDKYTKDKEIMDKAVGEMDKMQDNLKASVDKVQGWSDIMGVLQKGISNNELEIAKMKKTINDLKLKYGDADENAFTSLLKWPYAGFAALLLSIVAISVALAR